MKLKINGEEREVNGQTLLDVLSQFDINPKTVVIEHNKTVVARDLLGSASLKEGDSVEIVQFVGGGSFPEEQSAEPSLPSAPESPALEAAEEQTDKKKESKSKSAAKGPAKKKTKKKRKKSSSKKKSKEPVNGAKRLVIVESPAKARTINKFLGNDYQVEASMGHVRDLPKSKMGVDIEDNFKPNYIVMMKARKTVKHLKSQAKGKEEIFLAPDPDREGEAISWHLAHIFKEAYDETPVRRVVFNEITKTAIQEAFHHPRSIEMNLVNAQQARRILDRIVGYELSPLLWKKVGKGLSAGRVQSVALRLIVEREREIKKFVPEEYWSIEAKLSSDKEANKGKTFIAKLDKIGDQKVEMKNRDFTEAIRQEILKLPFRVDNVEKRERRRKPQAPYTTSKLQQEAYNRLGYPAAKTMRVAQGLYEGVEIGDEGSIGLITYMRTDSVNIAKSAQEEAVEFIKNKFGEDYLPEQPPVYKAKKGAQEAHEAIRPTSAKRTPDSVKKYLNDEQFKLYDLIWRKFLASQMAPSLDQIVSLSIVAGDKYYFRASGKINLFPGFTAVFGDIKTIRNLQSENKSEKGKEEDEEPESGELPELTKDEVLKLEELMGYQHFTKPPPRYNDASLVKLLEENGIGRPSTYAPTIYTLLSREYVNRRGGALMPTELGEIVVDLLVEHFPRVMDVEFTATMENELDKIEEGGMEWRNVLKDFYGPFQLNLEAAREEMKNIRQEVVPTEYICDVCGKNMVVKWGRFGKFLACPGFPDCRYTRSIPTGYRCPEENCGGELVKRTSKKRRTFYGCSNYPKCTHITNKLPKKEDELSEDEKISEADRETLGP